MRGLLVACRYLTVLPLPRAAEVGDLGRAAGWLPVVGLLVALVLVAGWWLAHQALPPLVAAVLVVALWAALTGGLHLDGLADTLDGLGGGWSRAESLAIMRDARTGAYGVTGVALVLALKIAALASLPSPLAWRSLLVSPVVGRLGPLVLARLCPSAREDGTGHAFALSAGMPALALAVAVATAVGAGALGGWGLLPVALVAAMAGAFAVYLRARLGGLTGDCLGALVEAGEAGTLTAIAALAHLGRL
jgi:adenosylcobinamide-GDP ribazoletransferase